MNHDTPNTSRPKLHFGIESCKVKRGLSFAEQRQWSNPCFADIEFSGGKRERTAAVQWEPAGTSNRAIPLGVTQRTTAASLYAPARSCWTGSMLQNKVLYWGQFRTCTSDIKQLFLYQSGRGKTNLNLILIFAELSATWLTLFVWKHI